ncbi:MAG: hypothetical protein KJ955_05475 [Nanoarchaeota archaeon]|nr:hypothetical protein [Nanoarchaeota archaeon]
MERYPFWILLIVFGTGMIWYAYMDNNYTDLCHQYTQMTIDYGTEVDFNYMMACNHAWVYRSISGLCSLVVLALLLIISISEWKERKHKKHK